MRARGGDRFLQRAGRVRVLAAQVDVAHGRADREAGDGHALDQAERVAFHQHAVGERARVAFVRVADDVLLRRVLLEHRAPLDAGGERRAAAPAQARLEYFVHDVRAAHAERAPQAGVAAVRQVVVEADRVGDADARERQALLALEPRQVRDPADPQRVRRRVEQAGPDQLRHEVGRDRAIGDAIACGVLDLDQRLEPDHAARTGALQRDAGAAGGRGELQGGRRLVGAQRLRGGITRKVESYGHQRLRQSARIASTRSGVARP